MGLGALGDPDIVFKRKFRWTFEVRNICGQYSVPSSFVKLAARPKLDIDEFQIDYLHGRDWLPGKGTWNELSVTYYDVSSIAGTSSGSNPVYLFTWLRSVYNYADPIQLNMGSRRRDYTATGSLTLYDGCGQSLETWTLNNMWPKGIDFGELDMASSDTADIQLTLRYTGVQYLNLCGLNPPKPCCSPC